MNNNRTVTDFFTPGKIAKSPIAKSKVNTLVNSYFAATLKQHPREVKDLHHLQKEIYYNPKTRFGTPERVNFGQQLRQIVDEEVLKTKLENDKLRALNRKFEQNMADIVKKLESFTGSGGSDLNTSINGGNETNNHELSYGIDRSNGGNHKDKDNHITTQVHTPCLKSVLKFQNELKYKQILRDYEVKNLELQQKYDELVK